MKKYVFLISGVIFVFLILSLTSDGLIGRFLSPEKEMASVGQFQQNNSEEAILVINDGESSPKNLKLGIWEGATAFDILKKAAENTNLNLETKSYDAGVMIETIGDQKNGRDGKYWLYYVNGQMPMVSADKNTIKAGDKIEFRFEKSPF